MVPLKRSSMLSIRVRFLQRRSLREYAPLLPFAPAPVGASCGLACDAEADLRTALEEIVVTVEPGRLRLKLHWKGGDHTTLEVVKNRPGQHRWKTNAATEQLICDLARLLPDRKHSISSQSAWCAYGKGSYVDATACADLP